MTHEKKEMSTKELREFGLITGAIVAGLFGLLLPWLIGHEWPVWPWYVFGVLAAIAIILPVALKPVYRGWMGFGLVMGWINTRLILGLVFYILFTPISLLLKILGKDPMRRKLDKAMQTYRQQSRRSPREQMEKPF